MRTEAHHREGEAGLALGLREPAVPGAEGVPLLVRGLLRRQPVGEDLFVLGAPLAFSRRLRA